MILTIAIGIVVGVIALGLISGVLSLLGALIESVFSGF